MKKHAYLFIWVLLLGGTVKAQVTFNFLPAINGQTIDGLGMVQIMNSSSVSLNGAMRITVKDGNGADVFSWQVPRLALKPGMNRLTRQQLTNPAIRFGSSPAAALLSQTGRFPEGEYEYCYEMAVASPKEGAPPDLHENCFEHSLQPVTPLMLIDPYDEAEICNTRPGFSWQPPMPFSRDMRYRLVVVPVTAGQETMDAMANNRPVINVANLRTNNQPYPAQAPDLVKEQRYAWQVQVHAGSTILTQSEIWSFTVHCDDSLPSADKDSYRELKPEGDKDIYIAQGIVRFAFHNYGKAGKLDYEIIDLSVPEEVIKRLPAQKMQTGLNKIDLPLEDHDAFIKGRQYLLRVKNVTNQILTLRFVYQE